MGLAGEDGHEVGVLLARELAISEEFVLRMVEAFSYFDKVSMASLDLVICFDSIKSKH